MLDLLKAVFQIFVDILIGMRVPFALAIGGAVFIAALLWLATFSRRHIVGMVLRWLLAGAFCASFYSLVIFFTKSESLLLLLVFSLLTGPVFVKSFRRSPNNKWFRPWTPFAVWVFYWVAALLGWRYGWLGLLTITLPTLVIAEAGLFVAANFILPFPDTDLYRGERDTPAALGMPTFEQELRDMYDFFRYPENKEIRDQWFQDRRTALRCLITYALGTNYPYYVVIDEKITERTEDSRTWLTDEERLIKRADGDAYGDFLSGPGIILTGCDHAVVLSSGLSFKGAKGPGIIFSGSTETPAQVVDLRIQLRAFPVEAWTKDGIAVKVVTFIPFQIKTGETTQKAPQLEEGFPYLSNAVFKAVHAQLVEHQDLSQVPENLKKLKWYDLPEIAGRRIMREIISHYDFDELYPSLELHEIPGQDPRSKIIKELREEWDRVLPTWGIRRIGGGISNILPVDERVTKQRIEAWRTDWTREIARRQAAGQTRQLDLLNRARAEAQKEIMETVGNRLRGLSGTGMMSIARSFTQILKDLAERTTLQHLVPSIDDTRQTRETPGIEGR